MKSYKYTCIVDTIYSLLLYLIYHSCNNIQHTIFFVGSNIPDDIVVQLPNYVKVSSNKEDYDGKKKLLKKRWELFWKYRFCIMRTKLYAQDHLIFAPQLICGQKYTFIEDAPRVFTLNKDNVIFRQNVPSDYKTRLWLKLYVGQVCGYKLGTHRQCINRIISSAEDINSPLIAGKKFELVDRVQLWRKSSSQKKEYIKKIFGITDEILKTVSNANTIFFSQPFIADCGLSEEEQYNIIVPYYERYKAEGFVIKPHPRDKFDYEKKFPESTIIKCKAPMQLLSMMGISFKRAITVSSTAVSDLPPETELIWIGNSVNPKLVKALGITKYKR